MVHQHFMLIPVMTVAENIVLGIEPSKAAFILDERGATSASREISQQFGLAVDPTRCRGRSRVGQQQRVEILKALYRGAEILILDEPTAVLTPQEATSCSRSCESLQAEGKSIIFITHKLDEVLEIADRITVLRRGKMSRPCRAPARPRTRSPADGRPRGAAARRQAAGAAGRAAARRSRTCTCVDDRGLETVQRRLVRRARRRDRRHRRRRRQRPDRAGRGDRRPAARATAARVRSPGGDVSGASARGMLDAGVGHIPEDRQRHGLVLDFSIAENSRCTTTTRRRSRAAAGSSRAASSSVRAR